jgi:hypothetical protein
LRAESYGGKRGFGGASGATEPSSHLGP